jgi:hypothetical protein
MTERIKVPETKEFFIWDLEGSLDAAIANLQKELDEGWLDLSFDYDDYWDLIKFREETDKEYESRLKAEEKDRQLALKAKGKRYEQYKRLKQEFADQGDI